MKSSQNKIRTVKGKNFFGKENMKTEDKNRITNIIKEWKDEAGLDPRKDIVLISAHSDISEILKICTNKPGYMIGKGGCLVNKYKSIICDKFPNIKNIEFIETDFWYIR